MGFQTQPFLINDFSRGITDNFINGDPSRAEEMDNLFILQNKSCITRNGSIVDDTADDVIPSGNDRIGTLINYNNSDKLLVQSSTHIYYRNPSNYATLTGPTGNQAFSAGDEGSYVSHTQWNRHLFITNDDWSAVQKIYKDGSSAYQVRTAGLPALASTPTITQAAFTKTGDTTNGSNNILNFANTTGLEIGQGISGTGIPASTTITAILSATSIQISNAATATNAGVTFTFTGVRSYIYTFHYYFTYTIGTQVFEDFGPTTSVQKDNFVEPSALTAAIASIPVLANGATGNYDTTNMKVYVSRTEADQTVGYKVGSVTNGTTTLNDTASDATAITGDLLYTTGGVLDNDPPPLAKFIHVVNNIGYYAHLKDGAQVMPNAYRASVPFDPDSCPEDFVDEVEDEIAGFSSVQSIPIILCKRHIYRVDGAFDEFGRGFMDHVRISDTAGCISAQSVVQAENGLYWAGNDGMYYSDGYKVFKITDHLNETYKLMVATIVDAKNIVGAFDDKNRRVYWTAQNDSSSDDNDMMFVLELRWGISEEMVFTTMSGDDSFQPSAITIFDQTLYRGDPRGYVFVHDEDETTDPKVDTAVAADLWAEQAIIYDYKSIVSNLGVTDVRKWVPKIILTARNRSNVSIQINILNDDRRIVRECKEIRWRGNFLWGDPEFIWGEDGCSWTAEGLIEEWRHLPTGGLRVSYIQVEVTNSYTVITNSDRLGNSTFDSILKTCTLDDSATYDWPSQSLNYYLSQESDDYVRQYLVTERTSDDVLTYSDTLGLSSAGSQEWLLKGVKKGEILNLLSLTLLSAPISRSIKTFETGDDGANAS